jgi:xanthine dehydrogenase accessory factor
VKSSTLTLIRGGGDIASGVALRLHRAGLQLVITELPQPLVVRRLVSFAEAVYEGHASVEGILATRVDDLDGLSAVLERHQIPVIVDPQAGLLDTLLFDILVDARMTKQPPDLDIHAASLSGVTVIGLGPGFVAGRDCHAVIETQRGHDLGRVIWEGAPAANTRTPESIAGHGAERVLRAPADGQLVATAEIGEHLEPGQLVAEVAGQPVVAPFRGVLRGLLHSGLQVWRGLKIGDVDPRDDPRFCFQVSDKSLAIAGGVLEVILSRTDLRRRLWD